MAIKHSLKSDKSPNAASMTDLMFQLLLFMFLATTLINPNALRLTLPQSSNQIADKASTTISITADLQYYLEAKPIDPAALGDALKARLKGVEEPLVSLHCDKSVPIEEVVRVMNIARDNRVKLVLATNPEKNGTHSR
ncbi:MAG: biopolymer transporter ExbD [Rikenellaceae bacterium]|jgi:biopolymer transport protein ExbD|nr:biopolymer transporter ExbD [Rikenellaceae bacterium]